LPTRGHGYLAYLRRWWWRRPVSLAAKEEPDQDGSRWADARARFWTEFREGEREAEARCEAASTTGHGIK